MNIPKKIKIAGYEYDVIVEENRASERGANSPASIVMTHQKMWIDGSQSKEQQESCLIHEVIEAINYHYELELPHRSITVLETAIYQVLKDNNLLK